MTKEPKRVVNCNDPAPATLAKIQKMLREVSLLKERGCMGDIRELSEVEVKVGLSVKNLIKALKELSDEDREFFIENLLAATSPEYLKSIDEAREDYKEGRTVSYEELFQESAVPQ